MYDIIIIGGGISGLYTAWNILKKDPLKRVLILEKENNLGGRIFSEEIVKNKIVEAGAGRFSNRHILLLKLIEDLNLSNLIIPINGDKNYFDNSILYDLTNVKKLIEIIVKESKKENKEILRNMSFSQYGEKIIGLSNMKLVIDSFGFTIELIKENAYDCIQLLRELSPKNDFYVLKNSLSQIIKNLNNKINQYKFAKIFLNSNVISINPFNIGYKINTINKEFIAKNACICALPKYALERLMIFKPIQKSLLNKVYSGSLCRIYSVFNKNESGKVWFHSLSKFTTKNALRFVIPIDEERGIIMISYSDYKSADYWKKLEEEEGLDKVNEKLVELMKKTTGIKNIPIPIKTKIYYWKDGVGYWKIGVNSSEISEKMISPFPNLFVCGENYAKSQQWIESALETAENVIHRLKL
jgi:protoporphyrinogen oxidase